MNVNSATQTGSGTSTGANITGNSTTGSNSTSGTANAAASAATVNYNSFLQLMVAELQNQDPTNPADPTQYMSQLASFSSVGQAIQTNQILSSMMTQSALTQADQLIGRTVTSADGNTSGVVSSVSIGTNGAITANLKAGGTLQLQSGVQVS
jgi:flagellar basal-body rod modification protein FlgD